MRLRINAVVSVSVTMLLLGAISLIASINYNSSILAFIGLGLAFWGAILLYIKPEEYTRKTLLEAVLSPSLITLDQMIQELGYKGDATYLPPKYFTNPETTRIFVSNRELAEYTSFPTPEQIQPYEDQPLARTSQGLLLTPPGLELSKLLEKSLGKSFIKTDLKNLQQTLPKLFIEDLEIAENLELQTENDMTQRKEDDPAHSTRMKSASARMKCTTVHAKITKPFYRTILKEAEGSSQITSSIGCPVCSTIAIALTKATGKPVRITDTKSSEDGNTLEASYEILEK